MYIPLNTTTVHTCMYVGTCSTLSTGIRMLCGTLILVYILIVVGVLTHQNSSAYM